MVNLECNGVANRLWCARRRARWEILRLSSSCASTAEHNVTYPRSYGGTNDPVAASDADGAHSVVAKNADRVGEASGEDRGEFADEDRLSFVRE